MKQRLAYIVLAIATILIIKMIRPYMETNVVVSQSIEMSFNATKGEMLIPLFQNSVPAPHVQPISPRKIQISTINTLIVKRLAFISQFSGFKTSPQSLCCFVSPNEYYVLMLRHLRI